MKYLTLILSNLKRHKLRTALTMLSILVAFLLFGSLSAIRTAFTAGIDVADLDRLIVRHKVSLIQMLPASYEARMEQIEGVDEVVGQTWFGGYYQEQRNQFAQMPVNPDEFMDMYPEYVLDDDEREAWRTTRTGAIAGAQIAERYGRIDGVVNCVGSLLLKPAHLTSDKEWDATLINNLHSAFYVLREAARIMMKGGGGSIVLISSAAARVGLANHEAIAAAKAGILGLTLSAAATYASKGIRVNAVAPGLVRTPMTERIWNRKVRSL